MTFANLKEETRTRRSNKAATKAHAEKIAMRATTDNPVSLTNLTKIVVFATSCIEQGASDDDAIAATRKYIQQLEGYPVE